MLPRLLANGRAPMLLGLCSIGLLSAASGIAVAYGVAGLFTTVINGDAGTDSMHAGLALLSVAALLLIGLQITERVLSEYFGQHYVVELREAIFDQLYALGDRERGRLRNGHLMTRFTADLTAIQSWVARGVAAVFTGGATLLALVVYLAHEGVVYGLALAGLSLLLMAVTALLGPTLGDRILEARRRRARLSGFMGERVTAMQGVRALRAGRSDRSRLRRRSRRLARAMVVREGWSECVRALPTAGGLLAPALILIAAGTLPTTPVDASQLILVMTVAGLSTRPLMQLSQAFVYRSNFRVARRMLMSLFRLPLQPTRRTSHRRLRSGSPDIDIRQLRIAGAAFTARAPAGARIKLSGPPGSGKSLLLRMLAGFDHVATGTIRIGGQDIAAVTRESLHRNVRLLSFDMPLLRGSLRRNLGLNGTQRKQLLPLLRRCGVVPNLVAESDVASFRITENGRNVGDSLRQRLLLARTLAGDPKLLLIDNFDQIRDPAISAQIQRLWKDAPGLSMIVVSDAETLRADTRHTWYLGNRGHGGANDVQLPDLDEERKHVA